MMTPKMATWYFRLTHRQVQTLPIMDLIPGMYSLRGPETVHGEVFQLVNVKMAKRLAIEVHGSMKNLNDVLPRQMITSNNTYLFFAIAKHLWRDQDATRGSFQNSVIWVMILTLVCPVYACRTLQTREWTGDSFVRDVRSHTRTLGRGLCLWVFLQDYVPFTEDQADLFLHGQRNCIHAMGCWPTLKTVMGHRNYSRVRGTKIKSRLPTLFPLLTIVESNRCTSP
jgi:hypothetical protein